MEKFKRFPIITFFIRLFNFRYSTCHCCKLPWNKCKSHCIHVDKYQGFCPVCEYCWTHKSKEENRKAVKNLYKWWIRKGMVPSFTESELLDAFEIEWEETHREYDDKWYKEGDYWKIFCDILRCELSTGYDGYSYSRQLNNGENIYELHGKDYLKFITIEDYNRIVNNARSYIESDEFKFYSAMVSIYGEFDTVYPNKVSYPRFINNKNNSKENDN